ncbi:hypothetical protein [Anabaena azotica]|uniref:Uncharacterized protein n=1 Tax=Anabaena azotica FACHB-119 TaxID=947527 RepID=A0ABR8DBI9_9NOST|nr:hypothetical protein [Anabaena azotica]MBD2504557.1 hypothetical protein [Anabaena azotica FACHB-119]
MELPKYPNVPGYGEIDKTLKEHLEKSNVYEDIIALAKESTNALSCS